MLVFDSVDPSPTTGGSSKEAGPSSVKGEVGTGLVGVCGEELVTTVPEAEPGEGRGKAGGNILKPGLFGEAIRAPGDKARLACTSDVNRISEDNSVYTATEHSCTHLKFLNQS